MSKSEDRWALSLAVANWAEGECLFTEYAIGKRLGVAPSCIYRLRRFPMHIRESTATKIEAVLKGEKQSAGVSDE